VSRPALGPTQPPIQWVPVALSPGVKRLGREADHSPPASAGVKKMYIYISIPPIRHHGVVLNLLSTGTTLLQFWTPSDSKTQRGLRSYAAVVRSGHMYCGVLTVLEPWSESSSSVRVHFVQPTPQQQQLGCLPVVRSWYGYFRREGVASGVLVLNSDICHFNYISDVKRMHCCTWMEHTNRYSERGELKERSNSLSETDKLSQKFLIIINTMKRRSSANCYSFTTSLYLP
jgi:hypothetical protein